MRARFDGGTGSVPSLPHPRRARTMEWWLQAALDYIPEWLALQMRQYEQPGCIIAISHSGTIVLDRAFGYADLASRDRLSPRHRFRIASHSKSFTAAGVMKLCEQKMLRLDDPIGSYVKRLNRRVAEVTVARGARRSRRRPACRTATISDCHELLADLQAPPAIEPNTRFKYSNHRLRPAAARDRSRGRRALREMDAARDRGPGGTYRDPA